ncbi:hypothetical protein LTS18_006140, partial [Coniosporium uncinatum]
TGGVVDGETDLDTTSPGIMFEKYADNSTNARGGGGEYEVVQGFGWTNGVLIWSADVFAQELVTPDCGNLTPSTASTGAAKRSLGVNEEWKPRSALELSPADAAFIKRFD